MSERKRKIAFASAAALLVGITAFLALGDVGLSRRSDARSARPAGSSAIPTGSPVASEPGGTTDAPRSPSSVSPLPSPARLSAGITRDEDDARSAPAVAPGEARAAAAAARAFLAGYLPYSYGRGQARRIRAAALPLLRELEASPPRVPATVASARPRLVAVRAEAATDGSAVYVAAVVDDGQRRYRIPLAVRNTGRRWVVTAIGG